MSTFNIVKKNRKYFAATKDDYKCKILIDENSKSLELGEHVLAVDDISVRSKYGTDLIFKLSASADEQNEAGICSLKTPLYNSILVEKCHKFGGKWDAEEKAWIFPGFVSEEVETLDEIYNSKLVNVELTITDGIYGDCEPAYIAGFQIAKAIGRDSGAKLTDGVALISGHVKSGGSHKNWATIVEEGAVIRMSVPEQLISEIDENIIVEIL